MPSPYHFTLSRCGEVPLDQVRRPPAALPGPGRGPAFLLPPGGQALLAHHRGHGVLADRPAQLAQVSGNPRRLCACKTRTGTRPVPGSSPHAGSGAHPSGRRSRRPPLPPHRVLDPEGHTALGTSRSIASSAFSRRSRASSARSSSDSPPFPSLRRRLSAFTQFPKVPSLMPRSLATCAGGRSPGPAGPRRP